MQNKQPLNILVTRPAHQAKFLCDAIRTSGNEAILFPSIEISEPSDKSSLFSAIENLATFDVAIFTSANAVINTMPYWPKIKLHLSIAAIGPATAAALKQFNIQANLMPKNQFSSEALLQLTELQNVKDKNLVIFTGENGKTLLAEVLRQRGARVTTALVYKRICPQIDIAKFLSQWQTNKIDLVICTSSESLNNLFTMLGEQGRAWLLAIQLLVISPAMQALAQQLGFVKPPILAENATDKAILAALKAWYPIKISAADDRDF